MWRFSSIWSMGLLLLLAATWPLWFPTRSSEIPLIPLLQFFSFGSIAALWISRITTLVLVPCLVLVVYYPERLRWGWWLVAGCLILSFLVDQQRLQPWAYQSAIYALVFASMDRVAAKRWLIPLAASIYLYSASGKFDFQFAHTVGQDFLKAAAAPVGGLPASLSDNVRSGLALLFPALELLAGAGILLRRTRRIAGVLLCGMHLSLIYLLGPLNRDHSNGVLLWNLLLMAQAYLLLIREPELDEAPAQQSISTQRPGVASRVGALLVRLVIVTALVAPLLERHERWDHWTSWSLYSPHTSYVDIEIHQSAMNRLSPSLLRHLEEDQNGDGWSLLDLGGWSLAERQVPIYPQARYQLCVAADLAQRYQLTDDIRARRWSVSDRWNGQRAQTILDNASQILTDLEKFWLRPGVKNPSAAGYRRDGQDSPSGSDVILRSDGPNRRLVH